MPLEQTSSYRTCPTCRRLFAPLLDEDFFLERISPLVIGEAYHITPPSLCPSCRAIRRLSFRNERNLFRRVSDATQKDIISMYHPQSPFIIYESEVWWENGWDAKSFGRPVDFTRGFFNQFRDLQRVVPRVSLIQRNSENSEYTNICAFNKDCYLLIESSNNERCLYGYWLQNSKDSVDCAYTYESERCYETVDCSRCYRVHFAEQCEGCSDSAFLYNCIGCTHCFGCVNQWHKKFCYFNENLTESEYRARIGEHDLTRTSVINQLRTRLSELVENLPRRATIQNSIENATGCYLSHAKDCFECFNVANAERCAHSVHVVRNVHDCRDVDTVGLHAELIYESINVAVDVYRVAFSMRCWTGSDLYYCDNCDFCQDCFGCIGLRRAQYCILNTQYKKSEYEELLPRVIALMDHHKEWGEFFPQNLSPFPYPLSVAYEQEPLSKSEALSRGLEWFEEPVLESTKKYLLVPDSLSDLKPKTEEIFLCEESQRPFRITSAERKWYYEERIAAPQSHPDIRHKRRIRKRLGRALFSRTCPKCGAIVSSPIDPKIKGEFLCEPCFEGIV